MSSFMNKIEKLIVIQDISDRLLEMENNFRGLATNLQESYGDVEAVRLSLDDAAVLFEGPKDIGEHSFSTLEPFWEDGGVVAAYVCDENECRAADVGAAVDDVYPRFTAIAEAFLEVKKRVKHGPRVRVKAPARLRADEIDVVAWRLGTAESVLRGLANDAKRVGDEGLAGALECAADLAKEASKAFAPVTATEAYWSDNSKEVNEAVFLPVRAVGRRVERMKKYLACVSERLGRKVGYLVPSADPSEGVSAAAVLNDFANAVHAIAEESIKRFTNASSKKGRCYVSSDATEEAVRFCETWDRFVEKGDRFNLYTEEDKRMLMGIVKDGEVMLRVGSAPGHGTHVKFEGNRIRVRYYDDDEIVNEAVAGALTVIGCKPSVKRDGVEAACPSEAAERVAATLSLVTSMDIRFNENFVRKKDEAVNRAIKELEMLLKF